MINGSENGKEESYRKRIYGERPLRRGKRAHGGGGVGVESILSSLLSSSLLICFDFKRLIRLYFFLMKLT